MDVILLSTAPELFPPNTSSWFLSFSFFSFLFLLEIVTQENNVTSCCGLTSSVLPPCFCWHCEDKSEAGMVETGGVKEGNESVSTASPAVLCSARLVKANKDS